MTDGTDDIHRATPNRSPLLRSDYLVLGIIVAIYLVYCSLGLLAPLWWGHYGYHGAENLLKVRNTLRFAMIEPARWTGYDPPPVVAYYLHRPIGYHFLIIPFRLVFGEHEWVPRVVAILGGLFGLAGFATVARRWWSTTAMGWSALVYITLPIIGAFAVLPDPTLFILGLICFQLDTFLQYRLTPTASLWRRAVGLAFFSSLFMWEPYFAALPILVWMFVAQLLPGKRERVVLFGRSVPAPLAYWLAVGLAFGVGLAFHLALVWRANDWENLFGAYSSRTGGKPDVWGALGGHAKLNFGTPPVVVGALWGVVFVLRMLTKNLRSRDVLPLVFLYVNVLYMGLFPGSFVVHNYLVFFLLGFFVLATIDLASDLEKLLQRKKMPRAALYLSALAVVAYVGSELPQTIRTIKESRQLMGTFGVPGWNPQQDRLLFGAEITKATESKDRVFLHLNVNFRKEFWYYMDRAFDEVPTIAATGKYKHHEQYVLAVDERSLGGDDRTRFEALATQHPVTLYGRWAIVDLRREGPGVRCRNFAKQPASATWRWFVSPTIDPLVLRPAKDCPGLAPLAAKKLPILDD